MYKPNITVKTLNNKSVCTTYNYSLFRRRVNIFLAICALLFNVLSLDAYGAISLTQSGNYSDVETVINLYAPDKSVEFSVDSYKLLKSPSELDYAYSFYSLKPYGYAVILNDTLSLMEACYEPVSDLPINLGTKEDLYYGGPFNIFSESDLKNMNSDVKDDEYFAAISEFESQARAYEENKACILTGQFDGVSYNSMSRSVVDEGLVSCFVEEEYFDNLMNFGNNQTGTCTMLAVSILLGYYDNYVNEAYVATEFEDGTGTNDELHKFLNFLCYGVEVPSSSIAGKHISEVSLAVNAYLNARNVTTDFANHSSYANVDEITEIIISKLQNDDIPLVISTGTNYGGEWNHSMVVYGVTYHSANMLDTAMYYVHTGWHLDSPEYPRIHVISAGAVYACGYLECTLDSHSAGLDYTALSASYHIGRCDCGYLVQERHTLSSSIAQSFCTKCGYRVDMGTIDNVNHDCVTE